MSKKKGIFSLIAVLAVTALILYTAIFGIGEDASGSMADINLGLDLRGGVSITYEAVEENPSEQSMEDTKDKLQDRVENYSTESQVYMEGSNRITIDIPGATDANEILKELGQPGTLIFCTDANDPEGTMVMDGNDIQNAQGYMNSQATDSRDRYIVQLTLTENGRQKFAAVTEELAETQGILYIVYDGEIVSAPRCEQKIDSETCEINGMSSLEEANQLASTIRIGALPVELKELRSSVVGAKLGEEAVQTSLLAGVIGLVIVIVFMVVLYRMPGVAASIALILYTGMIIVLLGAFNQEITLTLPGIAGIILSIGMAVDANVIIFTRIREEIGMGRNVSTAINTGFSKALSAIIDGNVTTLIAAAVLYVMGSGTVRGFAQTLALGIVLSMFTALFVTRTIIKALYAMGMQDEKFYGKVIHKKTINFLGKKMFCFALSGLIILIGIGTMVYNGVRGDALNYSLDFKGGTSTSVTFNENYTIDQLNDEVKPVVAEVTKDNDIQMTPVQNSNEVNIKTRELTQEEREELYQKLQENFGVDETLITYDNIGATVSGEMQKSAVRAAVIAAIFMLIYVWFRFKDIKFASSAVLALIHDVMIVVTCYAVFRWSVGNTFIACILTIVGYSINATIVIFDRIRENLKEKKQMELAELVNTSISQTLTRSINTSVTTVIMVIVLYIVGVESIREFALPLIVGLVAGTYSSVCLTGAMWYMMKVKFAGKKDNKSNKKKLEKKTAKA
ncbi:MAG TPA: protein translocase subunit SecD [Candidatus Fimimorpha excrementavium]|nr:protein translocase subunit SecD [Candidatus Fimimorpha excrementavium]